MFSFVGNLKLFIMEANELRIGNYVNHKELGYVQVYGMNLEVIQFDYRKDPYYDEIPFEKLSYVPLTEEILLKCKGTLDGYIYNGWDDMQFFRFDEYSANMFELEICSDGFYYGCNKIEFLHDLQNCYYYHENSKKELTVNL